MKKLLIIPLLFLFAEFKMPVPNFDTKDIFTTNEIVYYGLDFSKITILGTFSQFDNAGTVSEMSVRDKYFPGWNKVIVNEAKKYDLKRAFRKESIPYDLSVVEKRNAQRDPETIFSNNSDKMPQFDNNAISQMISEYNCERKDGIGLVFIMELFDKGALKGVMDVTFFDIATKKVLLTQKMIGKPGGFGVKSFWIRSVFEVLKQIEEREYKNWKNIYKK